MTPTVREITSHAVNACNASLQVEVLDGPGCGGASRLYHITGFNSRTNPSDPWTSRHGQPAEHSTILFQNGPIAKAGTNGLTHEVLLAILIDRLEGFQSGPFACTENALALTHLQLAQGYLKQRTEARLARGVEGTHTA